MRPTRVYVAGPITLGDQFRNVRAAILAGDKLLELGYAPFVPHLTCFWHSICPHPAQTWYDYDFNWLPLCDAMLRLPGDSMGAEAEELRALDLGIPVFYEIDDLLKKVKKETEDDSKKPQARR